MKTQLVSTPEATPPCIYPALFRFHSPGEGCNGEIVLATHQNEGRTIHSVRPSYPVGHRYGVSPGFSFDAPGSKWVRITGPVTITFHA